MRVKVVAAFSLIAVGALADEPPEAEPVRLEAQPVRDVAIIGISLGFAGILGLIDSTGEVHPQQVTPGFDIDKLLPSDRGAVTQTIDPNAGTYSDIALYTALGYALVDPILTGVRQQSVQAAIVDGVIYAESLSLMLGLTNLAKISVRRPRPIAYIQAGAHADDPTWMGTNTDSSASFFSGHASECAAVTDGARAEISPRQSAIGHIGHGQAVPRSGDWSARFLNWSRMAE